MRIFRIARPQGFTFVPGQYTKVGVVGGSRNDYTIASAPNDPYLEFCIERTPSGRVSPHLFAMSPGDHVAVDSKAKGDFALVPSASVHLMVATVTGIAPFRSMLRDVAQQNTWPGRFVVLHGASFAEELAYRAELEALSERFPDRVRYIPSVSRPGDPKNRDWRGQTGRVADLAPGFGRRLQRDEPNTAIQIYACGNPGMVSSVRQTLGAMGFSVATEAFD